MPDFIVPTADICPQKARFTVAPNRMALNYLVNPSTSRISNELTESSSVIRVENSPPETLINYVAEGLLQLRAGEGQQGTARTPPVTVQRANFHRSQARKTICRFRDPINGRVCTKKFSGQSELRRHEKSVHYRREADLISEALLDFRCAKYIKSVRQLQELTTLTCPGCGHIFYSQRKDSIKRHVSRGVCGRRQLLRAEHINWHEITVNN